MSRASLKPNYKLFISYESLLITTNVLIHSKLTEIFDIENFLVQRVLGRFFL